MEEQTGVAFINFREKLVQYLVRKPLMGINHWG
jgi:hypothetical protein